MIGPGFALAIAAGVVLFSAAVSWSARRLTRTTLDFYLAGRTVGFFTNASAILGDYFSAASFLGVAGAVYAWGLDGMWFGIGYAAGFVPLLLFFASPLRRFGEYTLPDFLYARFSSQTARLAGTGIVLLVTLLYLLPQMIGAGTIWSLVAPASIPPLDGYTTGVLLTAAVMMVYSAVGGMRGTTWNQAIQFWLLFGAVMTVLALAVAAGFRYSAALAALHERPLVAVQVWSVQDLLRPDPATGLPPAERARSVMSPEYWSRHVEPLLDDPDARVAVLMPLPNRLDPHRPLTFTRPGSLLGPLGQVSLVLTLVLGTSGLPHLVMRYFTHPSGVMARWSTVGVLVLAFAFYTTAAAVGVAGRFLIPTLRSPSPTHPPFAQVDGVLISADMVLPFLAQSLGGSPGLGVVAAGAIAAMLSTIGGLLMASAAALGHDVVESCLLPDAPEPVRVRVGRLAVVAMALLAAAVGLLGRPTASSMAYPALIAMMVTWAFLLVACGLVPGLLMAIWWKQTTLKGFLTGVGAGTFIALAYVVRSLLHLPSVAAEPADTRLLAAGLTLPTVFAAPLCVALIAVVSRLDRTPPPPHLDELWVRIHGTAAERAAAIATVRFSGRGAP